MALRTRFAISALAFALALSATPAQAYTQNVHKRIVLDAVAFMRANPGLTNYARLETGVQRAGYTMDQFAQVIAQGAYDVDDFTDTYLCGAITGDCVKAPVWGLGSPIARYTSYWHFQDHSHGRDVHGNIFGGYNYSRIAVKGDVDELAAGWLWNDHLDDGGGGMKGLFGETSRYNTFNITERNYRLSGSSTSAMYADYQAIPFQPITNLGQYWFTQFLQRPTVQTLGFVLHTTDVTVPQHTWNTLGNNHSGYEGWVESYFDSERLNAPELITTELRAVTPLPMAGTDVRATLLEAGNYAYANGALVLSSTAHADRAAAARKLVPRATAMVINVLNRAAERMVQ